MTATPHLPLPRSRSRRATSVLLAIGLALLVLPLQGAGPASAATTWSSGVFTGGSQAAGATRFGTWRGNEVAVTHTFLAGDSWSTIEVPSWWLKYWVGTASQSRMAISIPMLPGNDTTTTVAAGATGAYDAHFRLAAQRLVANGMGNAIIRPGWELNGTWYRWSAKPNPVAYRTYYQKIVNAMRSVPGQAFRFDWNVAIGGESWDVTQAYPGNSYVDTIGMDVYDNQWGATTSTPDQRWASLVVPTYGTYRYGMQFWNDFAVRNGKQTSFGEWGLTDKWAQMANGGGGGDNPQYIRKMYEWFSTHPVAWEAYFNVDAPDGKHSLDNGLFPTAAAEYQRLFAAGATATPSPSASPATAPPASPTPTTSPRPTTPPVTPSPTPTASPAALPSSPAPTTPADVCTAAGGTLVRSGCLGPYVSVER